MLVDRCNRCNVYLPMDIHHTAADPNLKPLTKGDTVQRGDVFVDDARQYEMSRSGVLLGCYCLGKTIIKDNGGWYRHSSNKELTD